MFPAVPAICAVDSLGRKVGPPLPASGPSLALKTGESVSTWLAIDDAFQPGCEHAAGLMVSVDQFSAGTASVLYGLRGRPGPQSTGAVQVLINSSYS